MAAAATATDAATEGHIAETTTANPGLGLGSSPEDTREERSVYLHERVWDTLDELEDEQAERVRTALERLSLDPGRPRPGLDVDPLEDYAYHRVYRLRIGDFRALFEVDSEGVWVIVLFPREKGYERVATLLDLELGRQREVVEPSEGLQTRSEAVAA